MHLETITPRQSVDKFFLQDSIEKKDFENFRRRLLRLLNHAGDAVEGGESEEHMKNLIQPFLRNTQFGEEYFIYPKEYQDLAIHNGKTRTSDVGVIIEAKRPSNREMISADDCNRKAFHESILYYLRERIEHANDSIKHIIITDSFRWFVFDAQDFERHFYGSKTLRSWYAEWSRGQKVSQRTQLVYDHLSEFVEGLDASIKATRVEISGYRKLLEQDELNREEQKKLVPLFKLFTPTHLLKLPFAADSNSLNRGFYRELLYIMGLQEYKEKGTHYITRQDKKDRQPASMIENAITQLNSLNVLQRIPNKSEFGEEREEQLFNVAIQLLIVWINRILFLKLLEAQLFKYHREDDKFRFLSHGQITEYDDLNKLFFQVLAVPYNQRSERINKEYGHIPYLNSSLFDPSEIEGNAVFIAALEDRMELPVYAQSKIRDGQGRRLKGESLSALEYLLRFLDAYSFNTEGTAEIQEEAKTLINASVLGRIFEKINGYKDGSFFTPGYITEYMCRETLRRAVVQKFNEAFEGWECERIEEVAARIARYEVPYDEANAIVNSITVCDPAVGSGHFLVSALNELIAIKSDLRILVDEDNHVLRDVEVSIVNDELHVAVGQEPFFEYRVWHQWKENDTVARKVGADTQRLQKTLFREKNILIENCLFGVDINPNSVNICRLRLWIELLKNAYYREDTDYQALEVLPNIDINIKQGNSLVSRYGLDADLGQILSGNDELSIEDYKQAVRDYKESGNREHKHTLKEQIGAIKEGFSVGLAELHPVRGELKKQRELLIREETKLDLFEGDKRSKKEQKKIDKAQKKIAQLEGELAELESARFYDQAFEWRFEFPEVLDDEGGFTGFDAVIGNPPYIRQESFRELKPYLKEHFEVYQGTADLYSYFIERGMNLLRRGGLFHYIVSNKWMRANYGKPLREWMQQYQIEAIINFRDLPVFEEASTYPCLLQLRKREVVDSFKAVEVDDLDFEVLQEYLNERQFNVDQTKLEESSWILLDESAQRLLLKLKQTGIPLGKFVNDKIFRGITTGANDVFIIDEKTKNRLIDEDIRSKDVIKPILGGRDINRFTPPITDNYILFIPWHFPLHNDSTINGASQKAEKELKERYPAVYNYLFSFKDKLSGRNKAETGKRYEWYALQRCAATYFEEFDKPKLILQDISRRGNFTIDKKGEVYLQNSAYLIGSSDEYLLGLLNSKLIEFIYKGISSSYRGGYLRFIHQYLEQIPIVRPNENDSKQIESLVDQILTAKSEDPDADTCTLEAEIDRLVYELYGLSEEEIGIVEGS